ncbi:MAG: hypothetical protein IRY99_13090 [Isosphaeraceae bacterium]|nr:hypothetical protein [Isosphaeraceae bacterium]
MRRADIIVVAKVISLGSAVGLRGVTSYSAVSLKPLDILKGGEEALGLQTVPLSVRQENEVAPREGQEYLFFVEKTDQGPLTIKVLPKTEKSLKAAKAKPEP